ncbi:MAG: Gfo/Idh/MocA family oxidoreductase [Cyclobacteriaceae bacterium]|nr:Gfo/Idh/MocA family oxidoreductase [Cyclobacteriaceae bacterium]
MKQLLIIGAGQLGSRHLQGLVKLTERSRIFVVDPSEEALRVARDRAGEIQHNHELFFFQTLTQLPNAIDLVIVATNSLVREKVTTQLLASFRVGFLVLEKVLFPDIKAYKQISVQLEKSRTPCWVNHPRRMFQHYKRIKKALTSSEPTTFQAAGGNWGLGSNGLHLLDIFSYLDGSVLKSLHVDFLDDTINASKRGGYIEFTGTLSGQFSSGSTFQITSWAGEPSPLTLTIFQSSIRFVVQEGSAVQVLKFDKRSNYKPESQTGTPLFQSSLTTDLATQLFKTGNCDLPRYEDARILHEKFLTALLIKYNQLTNQDTTVCPIT